MTTQSQTAQRIAKRPQIKTGWSSLQRALASVLAAFSLPLLLLAAISATKLFDAVGIIEPRGWLKIAVEWQAHIIDLARSWLAALRVSIPAYVFDIGFFYLFVGNAVARAEADELLAVELDEGTAWSTFATGLRRLRADYFFYGIPQLVRGLAVRLLWPVAASYRLGTPYVVDGPGPGGDDISTSVRRREMRKFARMVAKAGQWEKQTVYDHRLVLLFQCGLGFASSLALHALSKLM